jgi:hypothetical protein
MAGHPSTRDNVAPHAHGARARDVHAYANRLRSRCGGTSDDESAEHSDQGDEPQAADFHPAHHLAIRGEPQGPRLGPDQAGFSAAAFVKPRPF